MKIDENTIIREIRLYFKSNFDLICHFSQGQREISDMHLVSELILKPLDRITFSPNTKSAEVTDFFIEFMNLEVTLRNSRGFVVYPESTLLKAGNSQIETAADSKSIEGKVKAILDVAQNPSFSDLDWIKKMLQNAFYKSKSTSDKNLLIKTVVAIYQENDLIDVGMTLTLLKIVCKTKDDYATAIQIVENHDFQDKAALLKNLSNQLRL